METRGRKSKTRKQKELEGTYRKDRDNADAPNVSMQMPLPPEWLDENELRLWKKLALKLNRSGILSFDDSDSFGMFCVWLNKFLEIKKTAPNDIYALSKCTLMVDKLGAKFGYTPGDRQSLKAEKKTTGNPFMDMAAG